MQKITPFLWFDHEAEEAAGFYTGLFPGARITQVSRYGESGPGAKGSVMTVAFEIEGQQFVALNGGPHYKFTPAVSFVINCTTQDEVDHFWARLGEGGQEMACGWVTDRFGLSWQVVPTVLPELLTHKDAQKAQRVMQAMMQMKKIDIAALRRAADAR